MAVKGLLEGWFGGRLGVWGPRTPKLPRAPRNGDPALSDAHRLDDVLPKCLFRPKQDVYHALKSGNNQCL